MFRRRGQGLFGGAGRPNVPPMLQRANQLMAAGDYAGAAVAYKELAQRAENRFGKRAPFLFIQAGRAAILSGQTKTGVADLRHGLTIFASQGRFPRMRAFAQLAIEDLKSRNLNAEAEEIASLLKVSLPKGFQAESSTPVKKHVLPTHCPSCGAAVRSDEVDWLDDVTAECAYCGSPVRGE
jgi:hypothetical protein